ncbi:MAG: hypothetical protein QM640_10110 [Niabella sp.]
MKNQEKRMAQMQQMMANVGKPGAAQSVQDTKAAFTVPFLLQAGIMVNNIDNPQFSVSYASRIKTEANNRQQSENELIQALKGDFDNKISALLKEKSKLKDGEGGDNARIMQIEKDVCKLQQGRQAKWLEKIAEINTQYIRKVEDLLNQRLQEFLFWNTIYMQAMQDPAATNYAAYVRYLKDLYHIAYPLFPTHIDGGLSKPCDDYVKNNNAIKGKIHDWEREHCEVDFGIDLKVTGGKMNCEGWSVYGELPGVEFKYERSVNPVTWETTGHSLSAKAGKEKEFDITKNLGGSIGATVETTIKFDGNMNPVDLIVTAAAGAEISGPMGGSAGVDLGSVELSVNGGFNTSGPGFTPLGSEFLK